MAIFGGETGIPPRSLVRSNDDENTDLEIKMIW